MVRQDVYDRFRDEGCTGIQCDPTGIEIPFHVSDDPGSSEG